MKQNLMVDSHKVEEILQIYQRDINCLLDEDRNLRKRGLLSLRNGLFDKQIGTDYLIHIFENNLCKNLLKIYDDKIESNRELAYTILEKYLDRLQGGEESKVD